MDIYRSTAIISVDFVECRNSKCCKLPNYKKSYKFHAVENFFQTGKEKNNVATNTNWIIATSP